MLLRRETRSIMRSSILTNFLKCIPTDKKRFPSVRSSTGTRPPIAVESWKAPSSFKPSPHDLNLCLHLFIIVAILPEGCVFSAISPPFETPCSALIPRLKPSTMFSVPSLFSEVSWKDKIK